MGEAKRKKAGQAPLIEAAAKVSSALRRMATAASGSFGGDCFLHAEFGRLLMADLGIPCIRRSGYAAWRVGPGDSDVIAHSPHEKSYLPPGQAGMVYHSWLEVAGCVLDFTSYQLRHKAEDLDALDGRTTEVVWCPDYLLVSRESLQDYRAVAQAAKPPAVYYESITELDELLARNFTFDPDDLAALRLLLSNPDMRVMGPNTMGLPPEAY